jgi:hypothetical protein
LIATDGLNDCVPHQVRMATAEEEPQDIIQFYNMIFIPKMEEHL